MRLLFFQLLLPILLILITPVEHPSTMPHLLQDFKLQAKALMPPVCGLFMLIPSYIDELFSGEGNVISTYDKDKNAASVPSCKFLSIDHFLCSNLMTVVDNFQFYVHIMVNWLEHPVKSQNACLKKCSESKNTLSQVPLLTLSHAQFITAALAAHAYQKTYIPGPTSGLGMWVSWSNSEYILILCWSTPKYS